MGNRFDGVIAPLSLPGYNTFTLRFTRTQQLINMPETCRFKEPILQSAIRRHLMNPNNLQTFLTGLALPMESPEGLEVLGEMAIPLGHIDILLKQRAPLGSTFKVPIEVKTKRAHPDDIAQLRGYMDELRDDCQSGVLIASDFAKACAQKALSSGVRLIRYTLNSDLNQAVTFEEIFQGLALEPVEK